MNPTTYYDDENPLPPVQFWTDREPADLGAATSITMTYADSRGRHAVTRPLDLEPDGHSFRIPLDILEEMGIDGFVFEVEVRFPGPMIVTFPNNGPVRIQKRQPL